MSEKKLSLHLGTTNRILRVCLNWYCSQSNTFGFKKFEIMATRELLVSQGSSFKEEGLLIISVFSFWHVYLQPFFLKHQSLPVPQFSCSFRKLGGQNSSMLLTRKIVVQKVQVTSPSHLALKQQSSFHSGLSESINYLGARHCSKHFVLTPFTLTIYCYY